MDTLEQYFIGCDWGTSSLRLAWVHRPSGTPHAKVSASQGIKKTYQQWKEIGTSSKQERASFFLNQLLPFIEELELAVGKHIKGAPIVISGMASSSIGMEELPYAQMPFSLAPPKGRVSMGTASLGFPHSFCLISGVEGPGDVMRGEEVQVIGLHDLVDIPEYLVILPGTHSKHILVLDHRMIDFSTYMTGELFELISTQSILANSLDVGGRDIISHTYESGIQAGQAGNLLNQLFSIRAFDLQKQLNKAEARSYLSGLLIGQELAAVAEKDIPIFIIGAPKLKALYEDGLKALGLADRLREIPVGDPDELSFRGQARVLADLNKASD